MNINPDVASVMAGTVAAVLLFGADQGLAQSSSGVSGYTPPPSSGTERPPSGPGRSRLPLVDPSVMPPGGSGPTQEAPPGTPGAAPSAPGQTGENRR